MGFYDIYSSYKNFNIEDFFNKVKDEDVARAIQKNNLDIYDFLTLLSPRAESHMEDMAQRANSLSLQHFGRSVIVYTPIYIANHCVNRCAYCSFSIDNKIHRRQLTLDEIREEAKAIYDQGLRHILLLTGESKKETPVDYIIEAVKVLREYFDSISIEIYPLTQEEYKDVIDAGVDGLTIYQEVYNEKIYDNIHLGGPKKNYLFRLDAPERACQEGIRSVNIGALLGLDDWRYESFFTGLHAEYLQNKYPHVEVSVSFPRIRPHIGFFEDVHKVSDKNLVQVILALRIFLPRSGITISTRERQEFRDNLIALGVTKMSAGVSTEVGGHTSSNKGESQFEISDTRSVGEIKNAILKKGYQPIFKDWMKI